MNKFFLVLATFVSVTSFGAREGISPTSYACRGENDTHFHFDTTSKIGKPLVSVIFRGETAQLPVGEVQMQNTLIGKLVTATDNHMVPVDGPTVRYTLVLPTVILKDTHASEKFETLVVKTTVANPFFRPTPFTAVVENNEMEQVECLAQYVVF